MVDCMLRGVHGPFLFLSSLGSFVAEMGPDASSGVVEPD